jgi:hypothetical protein
MAGTKLTIPAEFAAKINPYSGRLHGCDWAAKSAKGLFYSSINTKYLQLILPALCINKSFIAETLLNIEETAAPAELGADQWRNAGRADTAMSRVNLGPKIEAIVTGLTKYKDMVVAVVPELMGEFQMPFKEETFTANPIMMLHKMNGDFITSAARTLVSNPDSIIPDFLYHNSESGNDESSIEYDYTHASYADGTWHPEHLFTNSSRNKSNPYWIPLETNFISEPGEEGLGHSFYNSATGSRSSATNRIVAGPGDGPGPHSGSVTNYEISRNSRVRKVGWVDGPTAYAHSQRTRSQFPRWQAAGARRQVDMTDQAGYRDGATNDRRVQRPRGYNMANLVNQSTY